MRRAGSAPAEASLRISDLPVLATAIGFGGVLAPLFLLVGLQQTPASIASLLLNLETVFTALLAWIVFKENVDRRIALGMISIVCGGLILSSTETARLTGWIGPVSIAGACLCWGIDNNVTQKVSGRDPVPDRRTQGTGGWRCKLAPGHDSRESAARLAIYRRCIIARFRELWSQPGSIHSCVKKARNSPHWQLLFSGSLYRSGRFGRAVARTGHASAAGSGRVHGRRFMAAPDRTPYTLAYP